MNFGDFLLFPLYLCLFYFVFKAIRNKYSDPLLQKYHRQAFWVKMIACVAFIAYNVAIPVDSLGLYHLEGNNIYHLILKDSEHLKLLFQSGKNFDLTLVKDGGNRGYFGSEANFMVIRLDAILSFITLGRYAPINLIFAAIGFSGVWKLFLFFYEQNPKMHRQFAIAVLFFPTVAFWSSGLMKDTLCLAALGWLTYAINELLCHKKSLLKNLFIIFITGYVLVIVKIYILLAYTPFLILYIILKNMKGVKNMFFKFIFSPMLIVLSIVAFTQIFDTYNDELGVYAVDGVASTITTLNAAMEQKTGSDGASSNFDLGAEFDGTTMGLIKLAPYAIAATFFRPFIWEASKISQFMAAVESLVLIFFTLYILLKCGPISFVRFIVTDAMIMYCFLFALVFGLFVGASMPNFGTLVRYKIPCLPFYAIALFLIYEKVKEQSLKKKFQKATLHASASSLALQVVAS